MEYEIIFCEKIDSLFRNSIITVKRRGQKLTYGELIGSFSLVRLKDYPLFFEAAADETYFQFWETGGFTFGPRDGSINDNILPLPADEVQIGIDSVSINLKKWTFLRYAANFGHKALEGVIWFDLKEQGLVDDIWINRIKQALVVIEKKLEGLPFE